MNAAPGRERVLMAKRYLVRLAVVGREVKRFKRQLLESEVEARYIELLECGPRRYSWQFECSDNPVPSIARLAARWSEFTFLVFYEKNRRNAVGIAVITAAETKRYQIAY